MSKNFDFEKVKELMTERLRFWVKIEKEVSKTKKEKMKTEIGEKSRAISKKTESAKIEKMGTC